VNVMKGSYNDRLTKHIAKNKHPILTLLMEEVNGLKKDDLYQQSLILLLDLIWNSVHIRRQNIPA
jgi:hypothetical protein